MKTIIRYIVLMFLQVMLLNHLQLWGLCHPYLYVLVLLMMPIRHAVVLDLLIGAAVGLTMDLFCNTPGVHMSACVLMAYLRRRLLPHVVFEPERLQGDISIATIGDRPFLQLTAVLVAQHHLMVFLIGAWNIHLVGFALLQTVVSGLLTWLLVAMYNALLMRPGHD